jgi:hypothetical protein
VEYKLPKLRNYTTSISASKSIGEIQELLIEFGAEKIMFDIKNRQAAGVSFIIKIGDKFYPYKLSVKPDNVQEFLWKEYKSGKRNALRKKREDFADDAMKIAWRIQRDLLHSLLSVVATEQVAAGVALMGFLMVDTKNTIGELFEHGELRKALPEFKL